MYTEPIPGLNEVELNPTRDRFRFFPGLVAIAWLLSACQSPQNPVVNGAPSSPPVVCDGRVAWSAEVTTVDITVISTFWIAFELATAHDRFQSIHVDVTLDGEPLAHEMKYVHAAEPYSITCTESGQQFEASRLKYTLFLPALSSAEHIVVWRYTMTADRQDGVFQYPFGMTGEYKIKLDMTG